MKITIKQLRKIIKEELENTLMDSNSNIFDITWGQKGIVERENENIEVTYPVMITLGEFKIKTSVTYNYDNLDEPKCLMAEEGNFEDIGNEKLEDNMSEDKFFETIQKMQDAVLKKASEEDFVKDAKDTIEDDNLEQRDRNEMSKDPDAYYGVKGQFKPRK